MYNVNLVLTAELAADYFSLRELDAETQVVQGVGDIQQKGLQLVETGTPAAWLRGWTWRSSRRCSTPPSRSSIWCSSSASSTNMPSRC